MAQKIVRGIRIERVLAAKCDDEAARKGISFSEWAREQLRRIIDRKAQK